MRKIRHHTRTPSDSRGFTLMELIVTLGIFTVVVVAASDIFLLANRSQRKIFSIERTQADARFTMESIAREVRTGRIDYAYYDGRSAPLSGVPEEELALVDGNDTRIRFFRSDDPAECADADSTPCLMVGVDAATPVPITPKGLSVRSIAFYIAPDADPQMFDSSTGTYATDAQPRVTVVLMLESTRGKASERATASFQTTVATRTYQR